MTTRVGKWLIVLTSVCCLALCGCPREIPNSMDGEYVIGGDDQRIVMQSTDFKLSPTLTFLAALLNHADSSPFVTVSYAALDSSDGSAASFDAPQPGTPFALTDGHWFVQQNDAGEISIRDLDDGSVLHLTAADLGLPSFWISAVNKPLLAGNDFSAPLSAVVVDAQSHRIVAQVEGFAEADMAALSPDHLFLCGSSATSQMVLADLNSGNQSRLADVPYPLSIMIDGDYGYWVEGDAEGASDTMTVRRVTLSTAETETLFAISGLASDLTSDGDRNYVIGFTPSGLLVGSIHIEGNKEVITNTWHPRTGEPVTFVADTHDVPSDGFYDFDKVPVTNTHPTAMVAHFVVYYDAQAAQWRMYDVDSQSQQPLTPFP